MNRRTFLAGLAGTPVLAALIAACGDDSQQASSYSFPQVPDTVVMRIGYENGFVAPGASFVRLPSLLVSGDGRVFTPGPMIEIYPGPLLPAILERSITKTGIQKLLRLADDAALLGAIPDYSLPPDAMIADAPDTVVTITVNGESYEHRANALGMESPEGGPSTPARDNLLKFVTLVTDVSKVAGAGNVGTERAFVAEQYRFQAMAVDPTQWTDPSPTIVEWPADAGVVLADSAQCATITASEGDDLFATATQLTFFQEAAVVYQLAVIGVLPGDALC
jgi:hypothetical protein